MKHEKLIAGIVGCLLGVVILSVIFPIVIAKTPPVTVDPTLPQAVRAGETPSRFVYRWHDDDKKATCWLIRESISCLRD